MPLKIYNSLTRQKEEFISMTPNHVGLYVCGPTVSGESHLGHARGFTTFDIVYRYLLYLGYKVRYVRNITDAGHFEEEGREAEDKISKKALLEKVEPMELVQKYTNLFHWAMKKLNNLEPSIEPTATGHIVEQISMIEKLIESGFAYEINGSVYFDVKKYAAGHDYGKLSGRKIDDLLETTRLLEGQDEKRNKADFALWKSAPPEHIMRWKSPWGEGFPGWHIECSAMATKYLGPRFDIHGGGMDLLFPHHESEIAQSTICNNMQPAKYWMHNNMITIGGKKMGKSYNNVIKLTEIFSGNHDLLKQAFHPMTIRFFILQSHYRSTLDFSNEALIAADKGRRRLMNAYNNLNLLNYNVKRYGVSINEELDSRIDETCDFPFIEMDEDFNTAKALAHLMTLVNTINGFKNKVLLVEEIKQQTFEKLKKTFKIFIEDIFGLKDSTDILLKEVLDVLIDIREDSKRKNDFETSDIIRTKLANLDIQILDDKNGFSDWEILDSDGKRKIEYNKSSERFSDIKEKLFERFFEEGEELDAGEFITIFRSATQETNIFISNERMICILTNLKYKVSKFKWFLHKEEIITDTGDFRIKIVAHVNNEKRIGKIDFGKNHRDWIYSVKLFNQPTIIENKIKDLLLKKMKN